MPTISTLNESEMNLYAQQKYSTKGKCYCERNR